MKTLQQRRLFFKAAHLLKEGVLHRGWTVAILSAALLFGCSSLTPERVNVIAAIAGQAAAIGAADYLARHPEHKPAFQAVIDALSAVYKNGNTNEQALEYAFVERMESLPVDSLKGPDGDLYVTGGSTNFLRSTEGGLVVWDAHMNKSVAVRGEATRPVLKATLVGLKRAMVPKPPAPIVRKRGELEWKEESEGTVFINASNRFVGINNYEGQAWFTPTNQLHISSSPRTNVVYSVTDRGTNNSTVLRWIQTPRSTYYIECDHGHGWRRYQQMSNAAATGVTNVTVPAGGNWRVVRVR